MNAHKFCHPHPLAAPEKARGSRQTVTGPRKSSHVTEQRGISHFPQTWRTRIVAVAITAPTEIATITTTHRANRAPCGRPAPNSFDTLVLRRKQLKKQFLEGIASLRNPIMPLKASGENPVHVFEQEEENLINNPIKATLTQYEMEFAKAAPLLPSPIPNTRSQHTKTWNKAANPELSIMGMTMFCVCKNLLRHWRMAYAKMPGIIHRLYCPASREISRSWPRATRIAAV
nr:hypothetical protein Iba_chr07aCG15180 [Ipomoea batatas]